MNLVARADWRSLTDGGAEQCTLWQRGDGYAIEGFAIRLDGGYWRFDYCVDLNARWFTERAEVRWQRTEASGRMLLEHDGNGEWTIDGAPSAPLSGCRDVDFGFSPVTNLMPIRRLGSEEGAEVGVYAAWLRFPALEVSAAEQTYTRLGAGRVRYESSSGYRTDLRISEYGFVTHYPELWIPLSHHKDS